MIGSWRLIKKITVQSELLLQSKLNAAIKFQTLLLWKNGKQMNFPVRLRVNENLVAAETTPNYSILPEWNYLIVQMHVGKLE
jgi:hypothetical protein